MYYIADVLKSLPDNFIPIWYERMYRGNAVQRILSAHPECAWEKLWCSSPDSSITSPLDFPETHSAFNGGDENLKNLGEMESHAWAHTGFGLHDLETETLKMFVKATRTYKDKLVFFSQHPTGVWSNSKLQRVDWSLVSIKKQNIFLYSSKPFTRPFKDNRVPNVEPIDLDNVFNIDIAKLFNDDYLTFLQEYNQIVGYFNLTPKPNAIRAFILRYLEREKHVILAKS
jgi:hypothetical protein|tara:strand:+ start:3730 stop:4413 length:684 start_codon:yes stop_codon:yes gene_type:complete